MNKITYLCSAFLFCITFSLFAQSNGEIQRVRINFKTPQGYVRHLLLAFTPDNSASDAIDYGYDARNVDNIPDDLNWIIDSQRFVIQGVGQFDNTKMYPFGMFMTNSGNVEIALNSLENFDETIDVFVYDAHENTYTPINDTCYAKTVANGVYENRFFIAFSNQTDGALSNEDEALSEVSFNYYNQTRTLKVESKGSPLHLKLYNLQGQLLNTYQLEGNYTIHRLPIKNVSSQIVLAVLESEQQVMYKRFVID